MKNYFRTGFALVILCSPMLHESARSQDRIPAPIQDLFNKSNASLLEGNYDQAEKHLSEAADKTIQIFPSNIDQLSKEVRAEVLLRQGKLALKSNKVDQSYQFFQKVAQSNEIGNLKQHAIAEMNAGAALMRLGNFKEAAELMKKSDWDQLEFSQLPILYYNYARALEESGQPEEAMERYARCLNHDPSFEQANKKLTELAFKLTGENREKVVEIGERLNSLGVPQVSVDYAVAILSNNSIEPNSQLALNALQVLLDAWALTYSTPEQFAKSNQRALTLFGKEKWKPFFVEFEAAQKEVLDFQQYLSLEPKSSTSKSWTSLPNFLWSTNIERKAIHPAFARFLAATAKPFLQKLVNERQEKTSDNKAAIQQAFARILAAWMLNPSDLELAGQVASLTHDYRDIVDGQGLAEKLLVRKIVESKSEGYERIWREFGGKNLDEWKKVLKLHTFLGLLFEAKKEWGNEENVLSAIAQWKYAIQASKKIRELSQDEKYCDPGLEEHLAKCLFESKRFDESYAAYLNAGREYLRSDQIELAENVLKVLSKTGIQPNDSQIASSQQLLHQIQMSKATALNNE